VLLVLAGLILAVRGIVDLGGALTPLPHPRDGADLVEHGVYRMVRHPIYGGLIVASLGWALVRASVAALALTAVLWAFFHLKSTREEAWLTGRFAGYAAYRSRTKRFIPWLG
jgi:protein-S-isoprenylcysteine O-methyltransferase Ste14